MLRIYFQRQRHRKEVTMIKPVTMYSVVCDRCGKSYGEDEGIAAWTDICSARYQALESEWILKLADL